MHEAVERKLQPVHSQLLLAIELFVLGHEYAHHIRQHGQVEEVGAQSVGEHDRLNEFEADGLGLLMCRHIGAFGKPQNMFSCSGAGAAVVLSAFEGVRMGRAIIREGKEVAYRSETHPPLEQRLQFLSEVELLVHPGNLEGFRHIFRTLQEFMQGVFEMVKPAFRHLHQSGYSLRADL